MNSAFDLPNIDSLKLVSSKFQTTFASPDKGFNVQYNLYDNDIRYGLTIKVNGEYQGGNATRQNQDMRDPGHAQVAQIKTNVSRGFLERIRSIDFQKNEQKIITSSLAAPSALHDKLINLLNQTTALNSLFRRAAVGPAPDVQY